MGILEAVALGFIQAQTITITTANTTTIIYSKCQDLRQANQICSMSRAIIKMYFRATSILSHTMSHTTNSGMVTIRKRANLTLVNYRIQVPKYRILKRIKTHPQIDKSRQQSLPQRRAGSPSTSLHSKWIRTISLSTTRWKIIRIKPVASFTLIRMCIRITSICIIIYHIIQCTMII